MSNHLASELDVQGQSFAGLDTLRTAMQKLDTVLAKTT